MAERGSRTLTGRLVGAVALLGLALASFAVALTPAHAAQGAKLYWTVSDWWSGGHFTNTASNGAEVVEQNSTAFPVESITRTGAGSTVVQFRGSTTAAFRTFYSLTVSNPRLEIGTGGNGALFLDTADSMGGGATQVKALALTGLSGSLDQGLTLTSEAFEQPFVDSFAPALRATFNDTQTTGGVDNYPADAFAGVRTIPQVTAQTSALENGRLKVTVLGENFTQPIDVPDAQWNGVYVAVAKSGGMPVTGSTTDLTRFTASTLVRPNDLQDGSFGTHVVLAPGDLVAGEKYSVYTWQASDHTSAALDTETQLGVLLTADVEEPAAPDDTTQGKDVTGAQLRWSLSKESNARAHAPGTSNFLVAGKVPDPGYGGAEVEESAWKAAAGNVTVRKWGPYKSGGTTRTGWHTATWKERLTDGAGRSLGDAGSGSWNQQELVFGAGTGRVDVSTNSATVQWKGDATVVYYSGMSMFYLSDPRLVVEKGTGQLTATLSGYASSRTDQSIWEPITPRSVVLADLPKVSVTDTSFTVQPAYAGVRSPMKDQMTTESGWGSFPASLVRFADQIGTAEFWYSTGGSSDRTKAALPLTVTFDGSTAPAPSAPDDTVNDDVPVPQVKNPTVKTPGPAASNGSPTAPPALPGAVQSPVTVTAALPASVSLTEQSAADLTLASAASSAPLHPGWWWAGGGLLLLAAALLAVPLPRASSRP